MYTRAILLSVPLRFLPSTTIHNTTLTVHGELTALFQCGLDALSHEKTRKRSFGYLPNARTQGHRNRDSQDWIGFCLNWQFSTSAAAPRGTQRSDRIEWRVWKQTKLFHPHAIQSLVEASHRRAGFAQQYHLYSVVLSRLGTYVSTSRFTIGISKAVCER